MKSLGKWGVLLFMFLFLSAAFFDGSRFHDPDMKESKKLFDFLRFSLSGNWEKWPDWVPLAQKDLPPERVFGPEIRASFVNHASVLLQTQGLNILTDPVWSKRASPVTFAGPKRVHEPGVDFSKLPRIDFVLISHTHYDHLDLETNRQLEEAFHPTFLVGLKVAEVLRSKIPNAKIIELDWDQSYQVASDKAIHFLKAQHWSARTPFDRNKTLWGAFAIETPTGNIYFAGDTGYGKHFKAAQKRFGAFKLALLPIGAYEPRWFMKPHHMNPQDAVMAMRDLSAENALAIHHACFQLTWESREAPKLELQKLGEPKFFVLNPGEFRLF